MCLILYALNAHPRYSLILAANRDERYDRPSLTADFWPDHPQILAGRDLDAGGTWLGITRAGRFAAVTNLRHGTPGPAPRSRGELTRNFLCGNDPANDYALIAAAARSDFNGFNLLLGDFAAAPGELVSISHAPALPQYSATPATLAPGVYGLSNGLPDSQWPKVRSGITELRAALHQQPDTETLFALLRDTRTTSDSELPDTGIGLAMERRLSSRFISGDGYGTRTCTVLRIGRDGVVEFCERNFNGSAASPVSQRHFSLRLQPQV